MNKVEIFSQFSDSSSDSDDDFVINHIKKRRSDHNNLVNVIVRSTLREPRVCIQRYLEGVAMRHCEQQFVTHFRISRSLFNSLSDKFENNAIYMNMRSNTRRISSNKHIAVFLWFAAHEACSFRDVAERFDLTLSSVNRIISRIISFLSNMSPEVIVWPNDDKKVASSEYFKRKHGFPAVIGCIDGTHITIDPPSERKDDYIDRKGNVTLVLQAVCNEHKKFTDIFVGYPGSSHDSWVLKNSTLYSKLHEYCGNYYMLGDSAYPCLKYLLTPYKDNGRLTNAQNNYNSKFTSARIVIEHSFGILKQRFRQLYYCKLRGNKRLCHFIRACCVLHNIANEADLDFILENPPLNVSDNPEAFEHETGTNLRNEICHELQNENARGRRRRRT